MFPSSGYFRGLDCPFYASGLCERPYCHYRHAKQSSEKDPSWIGKSTTINQKLNNHLGDTLLLDTDKGLLIEKVSPLNEVAKPFTKPTYSCTLNKDLTKLYTYKSQVTLSGGAHDKANDVCSDSSKYKTYTKYNCDGVSNYQPSCDNQIRKGRYEEYSITKKKEKKVSEYNCDIASNSVPEYNPTPISELKRMHRYSTQSMTHSDLEYDPVSNFDAGFSNKSFFNLLDNSYPSNQSAGNLTSGHSAYKPTRIPSDDDEEHELVIDAKFSDESDDEAASRLSEQGSDGETKDPTHVERSPSFSKNTAEDFNFSARISDPSYSVNYKGSQDDCKDIVSSTINKHVKTDSKSSTNEKSNKSSKTTNDLLKRQSSSETTDSNKSKTVLNNKNKLEKNKSSPDDKTAKKKKISDNDKLSSSEKKSSSDKKNLSSEKKTSTSEKKSSSSSSSSSHDKKISSSEKKVSSSSSSEKKSSGCVSSFSSKDQSSVKKDRKEQCSKEKLSAEKIRKLKESRSIPNERELNGSSSDKDRSVKEKEHRKSESDRNGRAMKERVIKVENKKCEASSSLLVKKSSGEQRDKKKSDSQTKMDSNKIKPDANRKKEVERRKSEGERKGESKKLEAVRRKSESEIKRNELEKNKDGMSCKNSLYLKRKESEKSTSKDNSLIEKVRQETLLTKTVKLQRVKQLKERVEVWKANQAEHKTNPERDKIIEKMRKIESKVNNSHKNKLTFSSSDCKKSSNSTSNNVHEKSKKREHPSGENSCEHPSKKIKRTNSEQHGCSSSDEYFSSKKHKSSDLAKSSKHKLSNDSVSKQRHSGVIKDKKNRSISIDDLFGEESSEDDGEESSGAFGQSGGDESTGLSDDDELNVIFGDTDLSETDPYEECLRIFNESNSLIQKQKQLAKAEDLPKKKEVVEPPPPLEEEGKKRVAHPGAASRIVNDRFKKIVVPALVRPSPSQVMQNRLLEKQKRLAAEPKLQKDKSLPNLPSRQSKLSLLKHKISLPTVGIPESCSFGDRTIAGTAAKTEKRMAHMPKKEILRRPTIVAEYGSKITAMVRQRYLNLIIDEYTKIVTSPNDAINIGVQEENEVYKNCTSKLGYLNKAIHLIKRLRSNVDVTKVKDRHNSVKIYTEPRKLEHLVTGRALYEKLLTYILSEEDLQENHFPRPEYAGKARFYLSDIAKDPYLPSDEKFCVRCTKSYRVNSSGKPVVDDECMYHWAKPVRKKCGNSIDSRYRCCQGEPGCSGCEVAPVHVHHKNKFDGTSGYMTTPHRSMPENGQGPGVFAMDCEMVYTTVGMEVARVTVVNSECNVVYETFVRPSHEVLDYNTRFSGIQEEDMKHVQTNLIQVQAVLLHYFSSDTILIGHSLESDLMSVKLIHGTVIDTSVMYPHRVGKPFKRALKNLTHDYLNITIQESINGHDSKEDAIAAMRLVHYRLQQDSSKPRQ